MDWTVFIDPLAPMGNKTKFLLTLSGLLVDQIPNSQNEQHKSYLADSKEKYKWDLGSERVMMWRMLSFPLNIILMLLHIS